MDERFRTLDESALLQFEHTIPEMEVPVIMRHHDDSFPPLTEILEQPPVKDLLILRVLIRGPFVKHAKRPIFEKSRHQRQALPLTLRERSTVENALSSILTLWSICNVRNHSWAERCATEGSIPNDFFED